MHLRGIYVGFTRQIECNKLIINTTPLKIYATLTHYLREKHTKKWAQKKNADIEIAASDTGVVAICDHLIPMTQIEEMIITLRGVQVIVDRDLAMLYGVETKALNQAVRRNINSFPSRFRFQLTKEEVNEVVTNCDHLLSIKYSPTLPYVFTEQGVAMLASVLYSETAVDVSVKIMDAFVAMRHFIASNAQVFQRLEVIEHHQLEMSSHLTKNDNQIAEIFKRLDQENNTPTQGIFFDGQIFDAYTFVSDLIPDFAHFPSPHLHLMQTPLWWKVAVDRC